MRNLLALLYDGIDLLDLAGLLEVFSLSREPFAIRTIARGSGPLRCANGVSLIPELTLAEAVQADILLIPGGPGSAAAMRDKELVAWVRDMACPTEKIMSTGSGARLLAAAGLLDGLTITADPQSLPEMPEHAPGTICIDACFTDNGQILTASGFPAGIDLSLHVLGLLCGDEVARQTATRLGYDWRVRVPGQAH